MEENALRPISQAVQLGYKASKRRQRSQWLSALRSATFVSAKEWRSLGADFTSKAWTQAGNHLEKIWRRVSCAKASAAHVPSQSI